MAMQISYQNKIFKHRNPNQYYKCGSEFRLIAYTSESNHRQILHAPFQGIRKGQRDRKKNYYWPTGCL